MENRRVRQRPVMRSEAIAQAWRDFERPPIFPDYRIGGAACQPGAQPRFGEAFHRRDLCAKIGHFDGGRFRLRDSVNDLAQAVRVAFSMGETAEFVVPEDLKWADIFAAIEASHGVTNSNSA